MSDSRPLSFVQGLIIQCGVTSDKRGTVSASDVSMLCVKRFHKTGKIDQNLKQ